MDHLTEFESKGFPDSEVDTTKKKTTMYQVIRELKKTTM